jgi:hypothetical protein
MQHSVINHIRKSIGKNNLDEPRYYVGASSIGKACERQIWYQANGYIGVYKEELKITFLMGKILETMLLDLLASVISKDSLFCKDSELDRFQGNMDAIILIGSCKAILDIKTAKASSFLIFKRKGLRQWNETYYAQLQAYMGMTGIHKAVLLCLNKDSSELHEEWITFNEIYYAMLKEKARRIIDAKLLIPERINDSPLYYLCNMCGFKEDCHGQK